MNIITGRNNTGKTSLLQSLDLSFNPSNISWFRDNINHLINKELEKCSIKIEYETSQTTLQDFAEDTRRGTERDISIRYPTNEEVITLFQKALINILDLNEHYPLTAQAVNDITRTQLSQEDTAEYENQMREVLRETVSNISGEKLLNSGAKDNIIILQIARREFPFIHLGTYYDDLREELIEHSTKELRANTNIDIINEFESSNNLQGFNQVYNRLLSPRFGRSRFIDDEPRKINGLKLLKNIDGSRNNFDLKEDSAAIKVSQIEKYLKRNNIIDGLEDFSLDKIVIDRDGGPIEVPYEFLGDGTKTTIRILWELMDTEHKGNILLIEEPDKHMHPGYIENLTRRLIDICKERGIQLFITTHSIDLIESFFSPILGESKEEFLSEELTIIQLTDDVHKEYGYEDAQQKIEDLDLDLRGV